MSDTTVVIKTIGRRTLKAAISSAKREGFKTLVISDGVNTSAPGANKFVKLGKKWGFYGGMAANVGAALVETEYITFLDDDDELAPGAGDIIRQKIKERPEVDVWIGGVRFVKPVRLFNEKTQETFINSRDLAMDSSLGITVGNVAMPTYKTYIFSKIPFTDTLQEGETELTDFHHINACKMGGYTIDWFGSIIYLVRPGTATINGRGS